MAAVRTAKMAQIMGCTPQTIRKWVDTGKIPYHKNPAGQLIFTEDDIKQALGDSNTTNTNKQTWAYYLRSSQGKTSALNNQEKLLRSQYPQPKYIIKDRASGLNENRKGLNRLITLAKNGEITDIAITNKDRLTRFGYKYLEELFQQNGIKLHYIQTKQTKDAADELMDDFMALIASFSGRFYQQRNKANTKKLLDTAAARLKNDNQDED